MRKVAVERRTPSGLIVLVGGRTYKPNGRFRGKESCYFTCLRQPTPELLASLRQEKLVSRLSAVKWQELSLATLERVYAALKVTTE